MSGKIQNAAHYELPNFYWGERGAGKDRKGHDIIEAVSSLSGAAVLYRKEAFSKVGMFDEDFIIYGEDVDMALRLKQKGYKLIFVPTSIAYHKFHGTATEELSQYYIERNRLLFLAKHYPHKLCSSLLGSGYFTAKKSVDSRGKIYSIFPEIIMKLVKTHPLDITHEIITELTGEITKIVNYENQLLEKIVNSKDAYIKQVEQELQKYASVSAELKNKEQELSFRKDDLLVKESRLSEQDVYNKLLEQRLQEYAGTIKEKERELSSYKDELEGLSMQLQSRMDEVLIKDGQLLEKDTQISQLQQEGIIHLDTIQDKEGVILAKEKELTFFRNELDNLSNQLKSRLDEGLIKDGQIIENRAEIDALKEELARLVEDLATKLVTIVEKDSLIVNLNREKDSLASSLNERIDSLNSLISGLKEEIALHLNNLQAKEALLSEKETAITNLKNQLANLKEELAGIYNSEGFRFLLRPLWSSIWHTRKIVKAVVTKISSMFWLTVSVMMAPAYLFLGLSLLLEYTAWILFRPLLKITVPKEKIEPVKDTKVSLVIPNWNGISCLKECLPSIFSADGFTDGQNEVLVIDDGSTDESVDFIKTHFPQVRLIRNERNRGFGFTCNRGVRAAKNEIIVLINNDIILTKDFLKPLISHLQKEDVFAISPKLYTWDRKTFVWGMHMGHFEDGYIKLWNEAETGNGDKIYQPSPSIFAIGGAMAFRKEDFLWLGGFDHIYRPNCWEDIDISYRAWKRGLKILYEPDSVMYHKGKATLTYERHKEIKNELLFTWKNITEGKILKNHLNLLPLNLYRKKRAFLKGFFWALNYLPETLLQRIQERKFIAESEDKKIFDRIMLYYRNFVINGFRHRQSGKPNVLLVSRFMPFPLNVGGKIRIDALVRRLSGKYNFILLSLIDHEDELKNIHELKKIFSEVFPIHTDSDVKIDFVGGMLYPQRYKFALSYNNDLIDKFKEIQDAFAIDIIHIESNELLYLIDHIKQSPVVYTEHDISILNPGKSYYKKNCHFVSPIFDYLKRFHFHVSKFKELDKVITLSMEDEGILKTFFPGADITLVPTGVDLKHFSYEFKPENSNRLIFVGHYRHYPNEDAIIYFTKKIFPLIRKRVPGIELLIVGSSPTPQVESLSRQKNVKLVGEVRDVLDYLRKADVFVNSIRISAGIKGKILEAMAAGVPVVSTKIGSYGIDAVPGKDIIIADSPQRFAKEVIRLFHETELRKEIGVRARNLVENKYDWVKIADRLDRVYKDILFRNFWPQDSAPISVERILDRAKYVVDKKIAQANGLMKPEEGPEELHIELTYNCDSRCIMCDLWDYKKRDPRADNKELSLDEIRRLVEESRRLKNTKTVVLSGGEPFLRQDIIDICGVFSKSLPDSSLNILTNGMNTDDIVSRTKIILDKFHPKSLSLGSSLDGLGWGHDRIRGRDGAFLAFHKTIERCKKEFPDVKLSVTFTLTPYNIDQLIPAKDFADRQGIGFFAQFVVPKEARENFIWSEPDLKRVEDMVRQMVEGLIVNNDYPAFANSLDRDNGLISQLYYWSHFVEYQSKPQRFFKKCIAGSKFAMFNPYGELFFCPILKDRIIGSVREEEFDRLWMSKKAQDTRLFIEKGQCHCWLVCVVFPVLERVLNGR
jgi:GT2 family glycosyltransferase/glycosyltransferase involved in cell wall biosynthesis/MoaA/NifB/PqqE/SkfB family radical SAM enzyme